MISGLHLPKNKNGEMAFCKSGFVIDAENIDKYKII
jgi:hypothetical protein